MSQDLLSVLRDVVASVRQHDATRAGLRRAIARLPDAALVADDRGRFVLANALASELTGFGHDEILNLHVPDITSIGERRAFETLWVAFVRHGDQRGTYEIHTKGGGVLVVEYAAASNVVPGLHLSLLRRLPAQEE